MQIKNPNCPSFSTFFLHRHSSLRLIKMMVQKEKKPNNGRCRDSIKHVLRKGIPDLLRVEQSDEQTEKAPSCFFLAPF
ncbi:hypothetical protein CEXT_518131 [Caerostris extrusa]|uniref:Uncharacterized protein n=1 Tax=Caerostris extrusa TaxID=172846 RepID=A0AAV4SME7_CAEEX|nr:hypothetical protein CEXT_518131 [Caerostris extrusa]